MTREGAHQVDAAADAMSLARVALLRVLAVSGTTLAKLARRLRCPTRTLANLAEGVTPWPKPPLMFRIEDELRIPARWWITPATKCQNWHENGGTLPEDEPPPDAA